MSPRKLGDITNSNIISRFEEKSAKSAVVIDNAVHPAGDFLKRGTVLAKAQNDAGKHRAYAEGEVTLAFAADSKAFTVDPTGPAAKHFKSGDLIEKVTDSTLLGTIDTFDADTGEGMLVANSAAVLAIGASCRLKKTVYALNVGQGAILEDEVLMEDDDVAVAAYRSGYFVESRTTLTTSAKSEMGGTTFSEDEVKIL